MPSAAPSTPAPDFRYRAFISYSHHDAAWAEWLHKALETYRIPSRLVGSITSAGKVPRRLTPVFRDRDELASATDLSGKVNEALAESANLIVICSPHSANSRWVEEEVQAFRRLRHPDRIFCLLVEGEPQAEECFVPALRPGRNHRAEPIAADARKDKDGKRNAKLKLIAGMLDVSYDSLRQRELQRRIRRLTAIAAAALFVMAVTTLLAIAALFARHSAVVARADAERRQRQAETLVDFMLGDLAEKLDQVRRLDIMEDVDTKAMQYFASMPNTDVTDQVLAQRAKVLERIGSVRQSQGHLTDAIASFQASSKLAKLLSMRAPNDTDRELQYARTLSYIGQARWFQGELDQARKAFDEARMVLTRAGRQKPLDLELLFELEMVENNIGHVLEAEGRLDEAMAAYRSALQLSGQLVAADPERAEWVVELGGAHNNLGKLALLDGDLITAVAEYSADDAIESRLSAKHPEDNGQRESMLTVRAILGRTLALAGSHEAGAQMLRQSVDMANTLMTSNPQNNDFRENHARYATQLARLERLAGHQAVAAGLTGPALDILEALARQNASNARLQRELAEARLESAAQQLKAGKTAEARAQAQAASDTLEPLLATQPNDRAILLAALTSRLLLAATSTRPDEARRHYVAVNAAVLAQTSGRGDPRMRALQVEALLKLGRKTDVEPTIHHLWESGFRDPAFLEALARAQINYPVNTAFRKHLLADNVVAH
ncbi:MULTISPECIES: TIR domain-containing protein [Dyella]|uniref:Toll/interleukin-1 receptor domain-containing protein n=2 Tax=Dyella TaxID=231454 RepID=A0A4R0Z3S2_9GAMM|nr:MULTISPECIES: TIR domain-containing protein [Dyella]TBR39393.1 toll/interleukin-1 receptor domain-containing protein [Dyella terrae]TCI13020.1 toll/interleukin-1 receptor domain-containing protein [Dyella soli]